ncbi:FecR family protein [Pedobacter caeni]|uniref:FecR family protein n=1 Tax=Pedobacter caeni TaxID=288992 RepID=A0A1M4U622_9SPHI|nr:FecR family protein [Pedobacter caeni]SHE52189.1 FecR family protein [Pedobacter caeni]
MKVSKEVIERYHQGKCSPEEQRKVEQWLDSEEVETSFPENADLKAIGDKGWRKISDRYHITAGPEPVAGVKLRNYHLFWQLAACIALVIGISLFFYSNRDWKNGAQNQTIAYKEIKTRKGQKLSVILPDGTVAWLNSESTLRFPALFNGSLRELNFSGEAYFSVAKDPSKPFIIHTKKTKIQVLGTKFNLRALTTETATSVVVEEGKVKFSGNSSQGALILTANKRGVFDVSAGAPFLKTAEVYAGKYMAWKDNELLLDNLTISEAREILERWYDVKIIIDKKELLHERYTGSFKNPSLKEVMESMGFAMKFSYRQNGKTFILY